MAEFKKERPLRFDYDCIKEVVHTTSVTTNKLLLSTNTSYSREFFTNNAATIQYQLLNKFILESTHS